MRGLIYFDSGIPDSPVVVSDCFDSATSAADFDEIARELYDGSGYVVIRTEPVNSPAPAAFPARIDDVWSDLVDLIGDYCGFDGSVDVALCGAGEDYRGVRQYDNGVVCIDWNGSPAWPIFECVEHAEICLRSHGYKTKEEWRTIINE